MSRFRTPLQSPASAKPLLSRRIIICMLTLLIVSSLSSGILIAGTKGSCDEEILGWVTLYAQLDKRVVTPPDRVTIFGSLSIWERDAFGGQEYPHPVAGEQVEIRVTDPEGNPYEPIRTGTDSNGEFTAYLDTTINTKPGKYKILVVAGGLSQRLMLEVLKPKGYPVEVRISGLPNSIMTNITVDGVICASPALGEVMKYFFPNDTEHKIEVPNVVWDPTELFVQYRCDKTFFNVTDEDSITFEYATKNVIPLDVEDSILRRLFNLPENLTAGLDYSHGHYGDRIGYYAYGNPEDTFNYNLTEFIDLGNGVGYGFSSWQIGSTESDKPSISYPFAEPDILKLLYDKYYCCNLNAFSDTGEVIDMDRTSPKWIKENQTFSLKFADTVPIYDPLGMFGEWKLMRLTGDFEGMQNGVSVPMNRPYDGNAVYKLDYTKSWILLFGLAFAGAVGGVGFWRRRGRRRRPSELTKKATAKKAKGSGFDFQISPPQVERVSPDHEARVVVTLPDGSTYSIPIRLPLAYRAVFAVGDAFRSDAVRKAVLEYYMRKVVWPNPYREAYFEHVGRGEADFWRCLEEFSSEYPEGKIGDFRKWLEKWKGGSPEEWGSDEAVL